MPTKLPKTMLILGSFLVGVNNSSAQSTHDPDATTPSKIQVAGFYDNIKESGKEMGVKMVQKAVEATEKVVEEVHSYASVIKEAGFEMGMIEIEASLDPSVTIEFSHKNRLSEEEENALLEQHQDEPKLVALLKVLFQSHKVNFSNYQLGSTKVVLGAPFGVSKALFILAPQD